MAVITTLRSQRLTNRVTQLSVRLDQVRRIFAEICHNLFQLLTVTFVDSILRRNIEVRVSLNMHRRIQTLCFEFIYTRLTISQDRDVLFEVLNIVIQRVCAFLYLFCLCVPLSILLRVLRISTLKVAIELIISLIGRSDRGMQTIVYKCKTIEDIRTYVQRQHGGEHQVHHTNHSLSRGFRTVFCSTHY